MPATHTDDSLAQVIEATLTREAGAVLGGDALRRALGYRSVGAMRQAIRRGTIPVKVFALANRRGKFALAHDVATWLATLGDKSTHSKSKQETPTA